MRKTREEDKGEDEDYEDSEEDEDGKEDDEPNFINFNKGDSSQEDNQQAYAREVIFWQ